MDRLLLTSHTTQICYGIVRHFGYISKSHTNPFIAHILGHVYVSSLLSYKELTIDSKHSSMCCIKPTRRKITLCVHVYVM